MKVFDAMRTRRSVRNFKDDDIPYTVIARILEAARWGPVAGNTHYIKIIVVHDEGVKEKIADACIEQEWVTDAPVLLVVCSETDKLKTGFGDHGSTYALQGTAATSQNIMLVAEELGVSSCWVGAYSESRIKRVLKMPQSTDVHNIIALGYAKRVPKPPSKPVLHSMVKFDSWTSWVKGQKDFPTFWRSNGQALKKRLTKAGQKLKRTKKK